MKIFFKPLALSCALIAAVAGNIWMFPPVSVSAQSSVQSEKQDKAEQFIEQTLRVVRIDEIYSEIRYAARELYQPYYRSLALKLGEDGAAPEHVQTMEAIDRFLGFAVKASDELEPVLERRRDEIISDYAAVFAKHMSDAQLDLVGDTLDTPAARKVGNIVYAYSRILTGYTKADFRSLDELIALALEMDVNFDDNPLEPGDGPAPSPESVEKASAIVADLLRVSRLDDMVTDIVDFGNNTVLKLDSLDDAERTDIRNGLQQIQFYYNLAKSMTVAVIPSALANSASLADLDKLHRIVLAPVVSKSFDLIYDLVRETTSFSTLDLNTMKQLGDRAEALDKQGLGGDKKEADREFKALGEKWAGIMVKNLTPETRLGLERSVAELSDLAEEGERHIQERTGGEETQL
ncbi:MAG: hypothetical protein KTR19_05705 [Hyphomicrobiales bacterium]|nr:hypothetical protein [Hyphomicrobiales bacterium]